MPYSANCYDTSTKLYYALATTVSSIPITSTPAKVVNQPSVISLHIIIPSNHAVLDTNLNTTTVRNDMKFRVVKNFR